jgi:hypothetical protein
LQLDSCQDSLQRNWWPNRQQALPTTLRVGKHDELSAKVGSVAEFTLKSSDPEYAWVTRHTWQSWRERYKKNSARLDVLIAQIVEQKKPLHGEKGQYGYVRMAEEKPKRQRKKRSSRDVEAGMEDDYSMVDGLIDNSLAPMQPLPGQVAMHPHEHLQMVPGPHQVPNGFYQRALIPGPSVENRPPMILERTEEELDDGEEEWAVKIGDDPPPLWGKRKASEEPDEQKLNKKGRNE